MKNIFKNGKGFLRITFFCVITFGIGLYIGTNYNKPKAEVIVDTENSGFDLKLPGEVEKRTVTVDEVESRIFEIGELSTYCGEYKVTKSVDEARYFIDDFAIPGTKNTITISCTGNVKIGYDMKDIVVKMDTDKIYVALPEPRVTDNYIIWDSVKCQEENSMLNPIKFSQYEDLIGELEKEGLTEIEDKGIYDSANNNLKKIIKQFLHEFDGYEIVFM